MLAESREYLKLSVLISEKQLQCHFLKASSSSLSCFTWVTERCRDQHLKRTKNMPQKGAVGLSTGIRVYVNKHFPPCPPRCIWFETDTVPTKSSTHCCRVWGCWSLTIQCTYFHATCLYPAIQPYTEVMYRGKSILKNKKQKQKNPTVTPDHLGWQITFFSLQNDMLLFLIPALHTHLAISRSQQTPSVPYTTI